MAGGSFYAANQMTEEAADSTTWHLLPIGATSNVE
jgi:hypothetical protein